MCKLGILSEVDSMLHCRGGEKCHRKVGGTWNVCHKHFRIAWKEALNKEWPGPRRREAGCRENLWLPPLGCMALFVTVFHHLLGACLSQRSKPSPECLPHSLIQRVWLVWRETGFVASQFLPLRIPIYAALNGDYLEGKRSNHYLALALKTLSFNPKTLTEPIFPLRRVNHYPNLLLSALLSPISPYKNNPDMFMSIRIKNTAITWQCVDVLLAKASNSNPRPTIKQRCNLQQVSLWASISFSM